MIAFVVNSISVNLTLRFGRAMVRCLWPALADGLLTIRTINFNTSLANHDWISSISSLNFRIAIIDNSTSHVILTSCAQRLFLKGTSGIHLRFTGTPAVALIISIGHALDFSVTAIHTLDNCIITISWLSDDYGIITVYINSLNNSVIAFLSELLDYWLVSGLDTFCHQSCTGSTFGYLPSLNCSNRDLLICNFCYIHQRIILGNLLFFMFTFITTWKCLYTSAVAFLFCCSWGRRNIYIQVPLDERRPFFWSQLLWLLLFWLFIQGS